MLFSRKKYPQLPFFSHFRLPQQIWKLVLSSNRHQWLRRRVNSLSSTNRRKWEMWRLERQLLSARCQPHRSAHRKYSRSRLHHRHQLVLMEPGRKGRSKCPLSTRTHTHTNTISDTHFIYPLYQSWLAEYAWLENHLCNEVYPLCCGFYQPKLGIN